MNVIEYLLSVNITLAYDFKTKNGRTPLHTACLHGSLEIVKLFALKLDKAVMKQQLNEEDSCANTPFNECLLADHKHIAEYLMSCFREFINIYHRDKLENGVIHLMAQAGSINVLKLLFDQYYHVTDKIFCSKLILIDRIANDLNKFKMTPIHSAVKVTLFFNFNYCSLN